MQSCPRSVVSVVQQCDQVPRRAVFLLFSLIPLTAAKMCSYSLQAGCSHWMNREYSLSFFCLFWEWGDFTHKPFPAPALLQALLKIWVTHTSLGLSECIRMCFWSCRNLITLEFYHPGKRNGNSCWVGNEHLLHAS